MDKFILYLAAINVVTFLAYGLDKQKAKQNRWRIPEKVLLGLAALGGSIGAFVGMRAFHHKTKKLKFSVGVPVIFSLQFLVLVFFVFFFNK